MAGPVNGGNNPNVVVEVRKAKEYAPKIERDNASKRLIITLSNNQRYYFTVKAQGKDLTESLNWSDDDFAYDIDDMVLGITKGQDFQHVAMDMGGDVKDLDQGVAKERNVTLKSHTVTYKDDQGVCTEETKDARDADTQRAVAEPLKRIGKDFARIRPVSSPPQNEGAAAKNPAEPAAKGNKPEGADPKKPGQKEETVVVDPLVQICKGRSHPIVEITDPANAAKKIEKKGVDYALADQLSKMHDVARTQNSKNKYRGKDLPIIVKDLRSEYAKHIKDNKNLGIYTSDAHFGEIFKILKEANPDDLKGIVSKHKINWRFQKLSPIQFQMWIKSEIKDILPEDREILINIYATYITEHDGALGDSFINVFVQNHKSFKVAVINHKGDGIFYPQNKRPATLHANTCAFLHLSSDGTYSSYSREGNKGSGIADLDSPDALDISKKNETKKRTVEDRVSYAVDVGNAGRCLDLSIAACLGCMGNDKLKERHDKANELRVLVMSKLLTQELDNDEVFFKHLTQSIYSIPAFQKRNYESIDKKMITENKFNEILQILDKCSNLDHDYKLTPEQKQILREFYAEYIDPKWSNYLDQAFLYILPLINPDYKVAEIHGDAITALFPETEESNLDHEWLFVHLRDPQSETAHYSPIDKNSKGATEWITRLIDEKKKRIPERKLDDLFRCLTKDDNTTEGDPLAIAAKLIDLEVGYPVAFNAIAHLKWFVDVQKWRRDGSIGSQPGSDDIEYGKNKLIELANKNPVDLKIFLMNFTKKQVEDEMELLYPELFLVNAGKGPDLATMNRGEIRMNKGEIRAYRKKIMDETLNTLRDRKYTNLNGQEVTINLDAAKNSVELIADNRGEHIRGGRCKTKLYLDHADCLTVTQKLAEDGLNPIVLDAASNGHFGGGYLTGASAQEENMCRRTGLSFAVDPRHKLQTQNFYPLNKDKNGEHAGLYVSNVPVFRGEEKDGYPYLEKPFETAVAVMAAYNFGGKNHQTEIDSTTNEPIIPDTEAKETKEKLRTVLQMAVDKGHQSVVLIPFGCGAFCNPPKQISEMMMELITQEFPNSFEEIHISCIDDHNTKKAHNPRGNYADFKATMEKYQTDGTLGRINATLQIT